MIPLQRLAAKEYHRKYGEHHQCDGLLDYFELHERNEPPLPA